MIDCDEMSERKKKPRIVVFEERETKRQTCDALMILPSDAKYIKLGMRMWIHVGSHDPWYPSEGPLWGLFNPERVVWDYYTRAQIFLPSHMPIHSLTLHPKGMPLISKVYINPAHIRVNLVGIYH